MDSPSLDQLLRICKDAKVVECLSKLSWKGSKLQRCLFTKTNKDTLCDSLIFIAETLFVSTDITEEMQQFKDDSTSQTKQPAQQSEETEEVEDSQSQSVANSEDNRPTCKLFLENRCPAGIKGQKCTHQHPKQCRKFLQGGRTEHGCVICCIQGSAGTHTSLDPATGWGAKRDTPGIGNNLRKGLKTMVTSLFYGRSKSRNK